MGDVGSGVSLDPNSTKGEMLMGRSRISCGRLRTIVKNAFRGVFGRTLEPKHDRIFFDQPVSSIVRLVSSNLSEEKRKVVVRDFFTHEDVLGENGHEPANFILSFQGELSNEMFSILVSTFNLLRDTTGNEIKKLERIPEAEVRTRERFLEVFAEAVRIREEKGGFASLDFLRQNARKMKTDLDIKKPGTDW